MPIKKKKSASTDLDETSNGDILIDHWNLLPNQGMVHNAYENITNQIEMLKKGTYTTDGQIMENHILV